MESQKISREDLTEVYQNSNWTNKTKIQKHLDKNSKFYNITNEELFEYFAACEKDIHLEVLNKFFKKPVSIFERIKSFEDACDYLNMKPSDILCGNTNKLIINQLKLETIIKALNGKWTPKLNDVVQPRWYVNFSRFDMHSNYPEITFNVELGMMEENILPSLFLKEKELAEYSLTQFKSLYRCLYHWTEEMTRSEKEDIKYKEKSCFKNYL